MDAETEQQRSRLLRKCADGQDPHPEFQQLRMQRLNGELEQRVVVRTSQLTSANQRAEKVSHRQRADEALLRSRR